MKFYFRLQYRMANRRMEDLGIHPALGYSLFLGVFGLFSVYFLAKGEWAAYLYPVISLALTFKLSEVKRNDFLKMTFSLKSYRIVRLTENLAAAVPFVLFLAYKLLFLPLLILSVCSVLLNFFTHKNTSRFTLPTPFYRKPFEFTVGFRNTFYLFVICYGLTFISIAVNNFNLGIFSLLAVFLIIFSYYFKPENEYYVWSFQLTAKKFILEKIKTGFWFSSWLCFPVLIVLGIFFVDQLHILLLFFLLGYFYLATIILAKYAAFPEEMNLPQAILIAASVSFPPLLLFVIPYLFNLAVKRLQKILT